MRTSAWIIRLLAACALAFLATLAHAQSFPSRPLKLIVPFPPGGATDVLARTVGDALARRLGQPVMIDNRPGAGANLGAQIAAQAAPDGYTLLMAPTSIYAIAMSVYKAPGFDLQRDFVPVSQLANVPHVLVAHPSLAVRTLNELLVSARAKPEALSAASQGVGTVSHLELAMLEQMGKIKIVHVPYKGSAPAVLDLVSGRVQLMFDSVTSALPQIKAGKLVALGVTGATRNALLPSVPTLGESLTGYRAESWLGILLPARAPADVVERLNREIGALLSDATLRRALIERGFEPEASTVAQYKEKIRTDIGVWAKIVQAAGVTIDNN